VIHTQSKKLNTISTKTNSAPIKVSSSKRKKNSANSVMDVWADKLCNVCGTCAGMCEENAIELVRTHESFKPVVNQSKCKHCQICLDVCPGVSIDSYNLNKLIFGKQPENTAIGNFIKCYFGYATNEEIRWQATSGGLVTSLLIFMLENDLIDGALVTRMSAKNPLEPESFIAQTKAQVLSACGSKYAPVAVNVALKNIIKADEGTRFAVVGLPCHIQGIKKAEIMNEKLANKIILHLGLFCGHIINFSGTSLLIHNMGLKQEELAQLSYRGLGWPGKMTAKLKTGQEKHRLYEDYYAPFALGFFCPSRCLLCSDLTAEFADISFGDPWLPKFRGEQQGVNIVVTRTQKGQCILMDAQKCGAIVLQETSVDDVVQSQKGNLIIKKKGLGMSSLFSTLFGYPLPHFDTEPKFTSVSIVALPYCVHSKISDKLSKLLERSPYIFLKTYIIGYNLVSNKLKQLLSKYLQ
jgi:coenzyme F420 hydrogenase subunit beta